MAVETAQVDNKRILRACLDIMYAQTRTAWLSNAFCLLLIGISF